MFVFQKSGRHLLSGFPPRIGRTVDYKFFVLQLNFVHAQVRV